MSKDINKILIYSYVSNFRFRPVFEVLSFIELVALVMLLAVVHVGAVSFSYGDTFMFSETVKMYA